MSNKTSPHILSTSANLLGFCLFVITSLHFTNKRALTLVDELTAIISLFLATSSVLSFLSIRTENPWLESKLETVADYFFIIALVGILFVILLIAQNYIWGHCYFNDLISFWTQKSGDNPTSECQQYATPIFIFLQRSFLKQLQNYYPKYRNLSIRLYCPN